MIYVQSLDTSDFTLSYIYNRDSYKDFSTYASKNLSNAWGLILDSKVYYGPIVINTNIDNSVIYCAFGYEYITSRDKKKASEVGAILPEGWYINYMGCIYDYQGNIVE